MQRAAAFGWVGLAAYVAASAAMEVLFGWPNPETKVLMAALAVLALIAAVACTAFLYVAAVQLLAPPSVGRPTSTDDRAG
jgi:hypothetical protein